MAQQLSMEVPKLAGAKAMVNLQHVLDCMLEKLLADFGAMLPAAAQEGDASRRQHMLLCYLHSTRQQLMRLCQLVQWSNKARALAEAVEPGKLLDRAAEHVKMLQHAVDDMFQAHLARTQGCVPLFDVPTALEVLSTGTYGDLPSSIEQLKPPTPLSAQAQRAKLARVTHQIYTHLLKAQLPPSVKVVSVGGGFAVLRCEGLYEAKVTLVPVQDPPDLAPDQDTGAAGAGGQQQGGGSGADAMEVEGEEVTSGAKVKPVRHRWLLLSFVFLVNTARGPVLQAVQLNQLLQHLNLHMARAADVAVHKRQAQQREQALTGQTAGAAGAAAAGVKAEAGAAGPAASHMPASTLHGMSMGGPARSVAATQGTATTGEDALAAANQQLMERHAADEASAPLVGMHCILSDIAARLLLNAVYTSAQQLSAKGGRFEGHLQVSPSPSLRPGVRVTYWTQAVPLVQAAIPAEGDASAAGPAGRAVTASAATSAVPPSTPAQAGTPGVPESMYGSMASSPAVTASQGPGQTAAPAVNAVTAAVKHSGPPSFEVGIGASGLVEVMHTPLLPPADERATGAAADRQQPAEPGGSSSSGSGALQLDSHTVNLDVVLLRAAGRMARRELEAVRARALAHLDRSGGFPPGGDIRLEMVQLPWTPESAAQATDAQTTVALAAWHSAATSRGSTSTSSGGSEAAAAVAGSSDAAAAGAGEAPAAAAGQQQQQQQHAVSVPCLVFVLHGELVFKLSKSLFSGRLLLQPGPALASDMLINIVTYWKTEEDKLNRAVADAYNAPIDSTRHPGLSPEQKALEVVSRALGERFYERYASSLMNACNVEAKRLQLQTGGPGRAFADAYALAEPWSNLRRHFAMWAFEPCPCPPDVPPLHPVAPGTPPALFPRSLMFALASDHPIKSRPSHTLLVYSCSAQMLPIRVIRAVPVPESVSRRRALPAVAASPAVKQEGMDVDGVVAPGSAAKQQQQGPQSEMAAVVAWCKRRIVWETLVHQLKALSVEFTEAVAAGGWQQLLLTSLPGVKLPFRAVRRPGLSPPCAAVTSVAVTVGPDASKGEFVATVAGRFMQQQQQQQGGALKGESQQAEAGEAAGQQQQLTFRYSMAAGHSGRDLLADVLALIRMQAFLVRMERLALGQQQLSSGGSSSSQPELPDGLAADANGLDHPAKRARVSADIANGPDYGLNHHQPSSNGDAGMQDGHAWGHANHNHGGRAHNGQVEHGTQQQHHGGCSSQPAALTWHWQHSGTVQLVSYSHRAATLQYTSPGPGCSSSASYSDAAGYPLQLQLRIEWVKRNGGSSSSSSAAGGTAAAGSRGPRQLMAGTPSGPLPGRSAVARTPGWDASAAATPSQQPLAAMSPFPGRAGSAGPAAAGQRQEPGWAQHVGCRVTVNYSDHSEGSSGRPSSIGRSLGSSGDSARRGAGGQRQVPLPAEYVQCLEEMCDMSEEAMLLDALALTMWPMHEAAVGASSKELSRQGMHASDLVIVPSSSRAPFQQLLLCRQRAGGSSAAGNAGRSERAKPATLELSFKALGKTWLHLTLPSAAPAAAGSSSAGGAPPEEPAAAVLGRAEQQLQQQLGEGPGGSSGGVHVEWTGKGALGVGGYRAPAQLWALVDNGLLRSALMAVARSLNGEATS